MNKKILVPVLALSIMGGGIAGTLINGSAFAANSSDTKGEAISEDQEQSQLEKEATVTKKEAIDTALLSVPGKVNETELEEENGALVYSIKVKGQNEKTQEVKIDAKTGKVLKVESDEGEEGEQEEKDGEVPDQEEQKQLEKEATLTVDESKTLALKEIDGKVTDTELEDEDGVVVYSVEVTDHNGTKHDVKIDAKSGKVFKVEADGEDEQEGDDE